MNDQKVFNYYSYGELGYPEMHEHLLPLLTPSQSVLDLGFGTGHMCSPIAFAGLKITGVDTNEYWLEEAVVLYKEAGLGDLLTTVCQDVLDFLRNHTDKHDLVIMSDFLMFLMKTDGLEVIRRAYESLNSGGYLWITTASTSDDFYTHLSSYQQPVDQNTYFYSTPCGGGGMFCFYAPNEIESLLQSIGANIVFSADAPNNRDRQTIIVLAQKPA